MANANITDLKPSKLDPNVWYHVSEGRVDKVNSQKLGSMLQVEADGSLGVWGTVDQYWQFEPIPNHDGRYQLRCTKTTIENQLSVCFNVSEVATGHTKLCMASSSGNPSQQWDISDWGDGSYRIVNVENGTNYVLDVHKGNPPFMSSDLRTNINQPAQHWIMTSHATINDGDYSTVFTDVSTSTTSSSSSTTTDSASSSSSSASSPGGGGHKGLSSGAAAGIGIGVGLAVIAFGLIAFIFFRRRRRTSNMAELDGADPETSMKSPGADSSTPSSPPSVAGGVEYPQQQQYGQTALGRNPSIQQTPKSATVPPHWFSSKPHELPDTPAPVEAPTDMRHELDSTPVI